MNNYFRKDITVNQNNDSLLFSLRPWPRLSLRMENLYYITNIYRPHEFLFIFLSLTQPHITSSTLNFNRPKAGKRGQGTA